MKLNLLPTHTAAALSLAALLIGSGCNRHQPTEPAKNIVRTTIAEPLDSSKVQARSEYIAILRGHVETELSFKVGGIIELLGAAPDAQDWQEGARVSKGEVLARLKQEDFISSLNSARARAQADRQQHEREIKLRETGAVSQQELESASASRQASDAALSLAEQALKDSVLRAPYDGIVVSRSANNGETAAVGKPVLKLADLSQMSVELGIPDRLISKVQVGRVFPVKVSTLEASTFTGRVSEVGVAAKDGSRLFRVVVKVANPDGVLRSGMTASVSFEDQGQVAQGSVLVPLSALVSATRGEHPDPDQLAVFVVSEGKAYERPVKTDDFIRSSVIVTTGLRPGERVVTAGASTLYDGAPIDARGESHP